MTDPEPGRTYPIRLGNSLLNDLTQETDPHVVIRCTFANLPS